MIQSEAPISCGRAFCLASWHRASGTTVAPSTSEFSALRLCSPPGERFAAGAAAGRIDCIGRNAAAGTTGPIRERRPVDIRVDKTLVLINVTVTDPLNRFVTGLEKEHFRLYEEKVEQEITQFSSEDAPISIGLVFDTSGSMGAKLQKSRQAAAEFFKTANPADEFFLVQFNDRPELVVPFTTDTDKIQSALTFTQSKGRTALLDSVYLAMNEMKKAHNPRKALLIISDGGDNSSRYTETEIKNRVREADVQMFSIGIFESIGGRGARRRNPPDRVAQRTRGTDRRPRIRNRERR